MSMPNTVNLKVGFASKSFIHYLVSASELCLQLPPTTIFTWGFRWRTDLRKNVKEDWCDMRF